MINIPTLLEMLKAGAHFGHRVSKWHPNMEPYIYTVRNGVHIINLEITSQKLKEALEFLKKIASEGGTILFLGTKRQAMEAIKKGAEDCHMPYITERWLGGTLTNFFTIYKVIDKFKDLKKKQESGELKKYTKKEQHEFNREIIRLEKIVGGIAKLEKIPDAIFVLDVKKEKTAVREAKRKKVPIVALCDTNVNPEGIDYPIPANDDAIKSIEMMVGLVAGAIKEAQSPKEENQDLKENKE